MALQSSGAISLNDVNVELGNSGTANINMGSSAVRDLFGVSSGAISMSDGYGKSSDPFPNVDSSWILLKDWSAYDSLNAGIYATRSTGIDKVVGHYSAEIGPDVTVVPSNSIMEYVIPIYLAPRGTGVPPFSLAGPGAPNPDQHAEYLIFNIYPPPSGSFSALATESLNTRLTGFVFTSIDYAIDFLFVNTDGEYIELSGGTWITYGADQMEWPVNTSPSVWSAYYGIYNKIHTTGVSWKLYTRAQ
jgi:hypothetical protein